MGDEGVNHCQVEKLISVGGGALLCGAGEELKRGLEPLSKELRSFAMSGLCHLNKPCSWVSGSCPPSILFVVISRGWGVS